MNTNNTTRAKEQNETKRETRAKRKLRAKAPSPKPTQPGDVIKVGVDVGLRKYVFCRQIDGCLPEAPRLNKPMDFRDWLKEQKQLGRRVVVCYEAGLFGFELARWVQSQKMECIVMSPIKLDEGNKRVETDKLNARDICSRLDRYLAGNTRALTSCRIPSREEELARQQTRLRQQLLDHRKSLEAQGRSLLWQFGYLDEATHWWDEAAWLALERRVDSPVVMSGLKRLRSVIQEINRQGSELMGQLSQQAKTDLPAALGELPTGLGWLSMLILTREVMNWNRFTNRR